MTFLGTIHPMCNPTYVQSGSENFLRHLIVKLAVKNWHQEPMSWTNVCLAMLLRNRALRLVKISHVTWTIQWECFNPA